MKAKSVQPEAAYRRLSKKRWHAVQDKGRFYAVHWFNVDGRIGHIQMHREVLHLKPGDGIVVDHLDGDGLNNVRRNLRKSTGIENCDNRKANRGCQSNWRTAIAHPSKRREHTTRRQSSITANMLV